MTTTDHRAEAALLADPQPGRATVHALLAIHDLLDARLPRDEPEPLPEWEHALRLREERDAVRDELARARAQVITLTGDLPGQEEVVVRRDDVHYAVTVLDALDPFLDAENERWLTRLRAALEARS